MLAFFTVVTQGGNIFIATIESLYKQFSANLAVMGLDVRFSCAKNNLSKNKKHINKNK